MPIYQIAGIKYQSDDPRLQGIFKDIHGQKERPLCLCKNPGVPMYVAHVGEKYIIKRMPDSGAKHNPECESFEPPAELSGLGQVRGTAIQESVDDGNTTLKFQFSLSKGATRAAPTPTGAEKDSVKTDGHKLTLRGTLHYLWEEAGFNKWSPMMEGKRNWNVIRKYLLQAADHKLTKGGNLADIIYIPEIFNLEHKDEITRRRQAQLVKVAGDDKKRSLLILIGEVKKIDEARFGHRMQIKHIPDLYFMLNDDLYNRMTKRFALELGMPAARDDVKILTIATFSVNAAGVPSIEEAALMNVNENFIPIETLFDYTAIEGLIKSKRKFIKGLRYNLPSGRPLACAVLTDDPNQIKALYIEPPQASDEFKEEMQKMIEESKIPSVVWRAGEEAEPAVA